MNDPCPPLSKAKLHLQATEYPPLAPNAPALSVPAWNLTWERLQIGRAPTGGCLYGGQMASLWSPVRDLLHITNGPVGCGVYAQANRAIDGGADGTTGFSHLNLCTDLQERDIVFGGERKLKKAVVEAEKLFPLNKGMSILSTCPVALIGDDVDAVARHQAQALGKPVVPMHCAGFRRDDGVGATHAAITRIWRDWAISADSGERDVVLLCQDKAGAWQDVVNLLEDIGLRIVAHWPGGGSQRQIASLGTGRLVVSVGMEYWAKLLHRDFGLPWVEVDFFGPSATRDSLRAIAARFDEDVMSRAECLISERGGEAEALVAASRPQLEGRLFFSLGPLEPREVQAFVDFGVRVGSSLQGWPERDGRWCMPKFPGYHREMQPGQLEDLLAEACPDLLDGLGHDGPAWRKCGFTLLDERNKAALARCSGGYTGIERLAREFIHLFNPPVRRLLEAPWKR